MGGQGVGGLVANIKQGTGVVAGIAEAVSRVLSTPQLQSHLWRNTATPQPGEQTQRGRPSAGFTILPCRGQNRG